MNPSTPQMVKASSIDDLLMVDDILPLVGTDGTNFGIDEHVRDFVSSEEYSRAVEHALENHFPESDDENRSIKRSNVKGPSSHKHRSKKTSRSWCRVHPKRPISSYNFFFQQERPKVIKEFPNTSFADIARIIGQRWSRLDAPSKAKLEKLHEQDWCRYRRELKLARKQREDDVKEYLITSSEESIYHKPVSPKPQSPHAIPASPTSPRLPGSFESVLIRPDWEKPYVSRDPYVFAPTKKHSLEEPNAASAPYAFAPGTKPSPEEPRRHLGPNSMVKLHDSSTGECFSYRIDFRPYRMKESEAKHFLGQYCNGQNEIILDKLLFMGQPPGQSLG